MTNKETNRVKTRAVRERTGTVVRDSSCETLLLFAASKKRRLEQVAIIVTFVDVFSSTKQWSKRLKPITYELLNTRDFICILTTFSVKLFPYSMFIHSCIIHFFSIISIYFTCCVFRIHPRVIIYLNPGLGEFSLAQPSLWPYFHLPSLSCAGPACGRFAFPQSLRSPAVAFGNACQSI